ncbi:Hypothetical predicted protein [Olea europaea subsp. europaea]|uniref:FAR1 domain-containing protein n=1 Tax=Olea europaea subsp. europaea TaxID=158383 RepID=A0A8S0TPH3_OLEEU|nr:Hypothetical predicted protein [Olea europaea subsp. europaea]
MLNNLFDEGKEISEYVDEIIPVECDNEDVVDIMNVAGDDTLVGDDVIVPEPGMKFKDENEIFDLYKRYAYEIGFPVRKRNSVKDDDEVWRNVIFVCSREGKRIKNTSGSLKPQATMQSGCKARICASKDVCGI